MKKISIITPVFNAADMLKHTLESVLRQDYPMIEHVVADGGSTDGSVEILKEYEKKYEESGKKLLWVSEKDNGITDGLNKASKLSSGDLIIYMTDVFAYSHVITEIAEQFRDDDLDYTFGGLIYQRDGRIIRRWSGKPGNWRFGFMIATPTLCYTRSVWEKHGPYSDKYVSSYGQDVSDYDFQIKIMRDKTLKYLAIPKPLVVYYAGGSSNGSFRYRWYCIKECQKVLRDNRVLFPTFTNFCKTLIAMFAYIFASRKKVEFEDWMK